MKKFLCLWAVALAVVCAAGGAEPVLKADLL